MTREVLEHYFTKLGKSYYRSPEYERERQILREHGFIVSPISQFGIGFLSCFMLADKILIRTHPGQATMECAPLTMSVSLVLAICSG